MANTKARKTTSKTVDLSNVITEGTDTRVDFTNTSADTSAVIPDSALINVRSNIFGILTFKSARNGEMIVWNNCGEVQQVTMATLRVIKTENINFFKEQWLLPLGFADENAEKFKPADIYKQLYIQQYYKNYIDPSDYATLCAMTPAQIKETVALMSEGARLNLIVALNTYIENGVLDSLKAIKAFEEALGCDLQELN